mmetsp:Transcript_10551/g.36449  ORF Transcript_10551/g.36449 Transcript_10551/m.36449 type:complete len:217 (-) Transcript_10551:64-714(-)
MVMALSMDLRFFTSSLSISSYSSYSPDVSSPSSCIAALMCRSWSFSRSSLYASDLSVAFRTARRSWSVTLTGSSAVEPMALSTTASLRPLSISVLSSSATLTRRSGPATHVPPNFHTNHCLPLFLHPPSAPPSSTSPPKSLATCWFLATLARILIAKDLWHWFCFVAARVPLAREADTAAVRETVVTTGRRTTRPSGLLLVAWTVPAILLFPCLLV